MATEDQAPIEFPEMTMDKACHILGEASRGILTIDDDFKEACKIAVVAIRESELFWPRQDKE